MYGYGHRGMVRNGIGDANEDDELDAAPDGEGLAAEKIAVLRHDPDLVQQPSPSLLDISPSYVSPELIKSVDDSNADVTPDEPLVNVNERLNPAPRIKEGKKPGGRMENMRKAVVMTGPNAEKARRVRRLIRRYANTWYQRYASHSLGHTDPLLIFPLTDTTGWMPKQGIQSVLRGARIRSRRCVPWRVVWRTRRVMEKGRRWSSRRASSLVGCCTARQEGKASGEPRIQSTLRHIADGAS
jgi:hypothetical protein